MATSDAACCSVTAGDDGADGDPGAVLDAAMLDGALALLLTAGDAEPARPAEAGVVLAALLAGLQPPDG